MEPGSSRPKPQPRTWLILGLEAACNKHRVQVKRGLVKTTVTVGLVYWWVGSVFPMVGNPRPCFSTCLLVSCPDTLNVLQDTLISRISLLYWQAESFRFPQDLLYPWSDTRHESFIARRWNPTLGCKDPVWSLSRHILVFLFRPLSSNTSNPLTSRRTWMKLSRRNSPT